MYTLQSFQPAAAILDPAINTSLFQYRLVIIIKDTIESDKFDMIKEYVASKYRWLG